MFDQQYRAIFVDGDAFTRWGFYQTLTIPTWRIVADECNLAFWVSGEEIKPAFDCLSRWGFAIRTLTPHHKKFTIWAYRGNAPVPNIDVKPLKALAQLEGPRLTIGYRRSIRDFERWNADEWNRTDFYQYPIRTNYVDVNFYILSLLTEAKEAQYTGELWRFRLGDVINELVAQGYPQVTAIEYVREVTKLPKPSLLKMSVLASRVPEHKRAGTSWQDHCIAHGLKVPKRSKKDATTNASKLGDGSK